ncbi:TetR/AcrR family transcriptional regulator [Paenibacillus sp. J2TS4]|uniref:TetR/AcrR family transcriptional regulator n=1 Tax=Paenibacillus sp. J2TS4 TaxID=2807194 RepID=UPI001B0CD7E0|nr:TetR/AcrR family transcriptional regulator [Paenibacillus sp. J2TS4]GIP35432.1 TetR family transcriptional regulator [Paenibacillus sp. J2TS4]
MTTPEPDAKKRILLAAKKLFARQGYDGTSIRQICEEAGANVALVSYHFGGKENMLNALFDEFVPQQRMEEVEPYKDLPVEGIYMFIQEVIRFRMNNMDIINILQQEIATDSPRIEMIRNHFLPIWGILRDLLEKGRNQGLLHFRSLDQTFLFILGVLLLHKQINYFSPLLEEGPPRFDDLVKDTAEFIFGGLGVGELLREKGLIL